MSPILNDGDEVLIERVTPSDAGPGDLIAYVRDGRLITHVLCFSIGHGNERLLFLKGPANSRGDPPVMWKDVAGRVTAVRKGSNWTPLKAGAIDPAGPLAWAYLLARFFRNLGKMTLNNPLLKGGVL